METAEAKELEILKLRFDVLAYLSDNGIVYSLGGDNVSDGWAGIKCVFCDDHANHLGIHYDDGNYFSCWLCGESGDVISLIRQIEGCSFPAAVVRLRQYQKELGSAGDSKRHAEIRRRSTVLSFPKFSRMIDPQSPPQLVRDFFLRRNLPRYLIAKYNLRWVPPGAGKCQLRLVVPITIDGVPVSYQTIDMTGRASTRYVMCPDSDATVPSDSVVFGIDDFTRTNKRLLLIVEGIIDKWRLGMRAVALLRKRWVHSQLLLLCGALDDNTMVRVALDADAVDYAESLACAISAVHDRVDFVILDHGKDPDMLSGQEIRRILRF